MSEAIIIPIEKEKMNPQVTNIVVMLVMMQASRRIDMENENNINMIRAAYLVSVTTAFLVYQIIKRKIIAKNDQTQITIVTPKSPMKPQETEKTETLSVMDYDLREVEGAIKSIYSGAAMMGFMHLYMKYTNPLFMQCINPIKSAFEHNETKIHLFGQEAVGALKRPFKTVGMFDGLLGGATAQQTETESITEKKPVEETSKIEELN